MISVFVTGFALGLGLICAIGAQNAFVLRQGIRGQFVLPVVMTCALSDVVLLCAGIWGFAALSAWLPGVVPVARWLGAAFLLAYGALAARSALRGGAAMALDGADAQSLTRALATCLALTWLNPHVYLDTVLLMGSVATGYEGQRGAFALGAICASFAFFFALGYGAQFLRPLFARPGAWRVLDAGIALTMWSIAAGVILGNA